MFSSLYAPSVGLERELERELKRELKRDKEREIRRENWRERVRRERKKREKLPLAPPTTDSAKVKIKRGYVYLFNE